MGQNTGTGNGNDLTLPEPTKQIHQTSAHVVGRARADEKNCWLRPLGIAEPRSREELEELYNFIEPDDKTVVYCRIGERSSHTWFVLTHLLGYPLVRNYDGSWTEWGNLVRAPVVRGTAPGGLATG